MRAKERARVERAANESWRVDWGRIKRWIRRMVTIEPQVMREVSSCQFGDLGKWIARGKGNVAACGCLVGSVALKMANRGGLKAYPADETFGKVDIDDWGQKTRETIAAPEVIARYAQIQEAFRGDMIDEARDVGLASERLGTELGQDDAVALIKDEIKRQLKIRRERRARFLASRAT